MLVRIDRIQIAVPDRAAAAEGWRELLGAEHHGDDQVKSLGARRSLYRLGDGWIEFLEPDGAGAVADAVSARAGHLFAAGASAADVAAVAARLREKNIDAPVEAGQLHLGPAETGGKGLRLVVSPDVPLKPVGAIDELYEVTNLVSDAPAATAHFAELFRLESENFVPIDSAHYGYAGTLTLFDRDRLDRLEIITPRVSENTMGRFFARQGQSLYMAFAESGELELIEERARERRVGFTPVPGPKKRGDGPLQTVFLHPPALGGMMLGLSRRTQAWSWSGHPERVQDAR